MSQNRAAVHRQNPHRHFLDTMTLARALLGPVNLSLDSLASMLGTETRKVSNDDFAREIDDEFLSYARGDVQATWEIYQKLRDLYKQHGVSKPIHKIYSEASLGKAYLADFGIKPFAEKNPDFDPVTTGAFPEGYYGGRSAIHIRRKITEVMHADFKSQYSTVNGLMRLQDLMLAEEIDVEKNGRAKEFLEGVTLADLQKKETWTKLRGVALIPAERRRPSFPNGISVSRCCG
jgi:hypothetical protein